MGDEDARVLALAVGGERAVGLPVTGEEKEKPERPVGGGGAHRDNSPPRILPPPPP